MTGKEFLKLKGKRTNREIALLLGVTEMTVFRWGKSGPPHWRDDYVREHIKRRTR